MKDEANYIIITISGALSGSYNSATLAKNTILEKYPNRNIEVINSKSTGPEIVLLIERIIELIKEKKTFSEVVKLSNEYLSGSKITFALSSYDNLIKAGRMPKLIGFIAKLFGIWGVGIASNEGRINVIKKVRGEKQAMKAIIDDIKSRVLYPMSLIISYCHNLKFATELMNLIKSKWNEVLVKIIPTRGLCSYYAEKNGVLVGFYGKPILNN